MKISSGLVMALMSGMVCAQTCNPALVRTAPDARYQSQDSQVLDKTGGLIWQRCTVGQSWNGSACIGEPVLYEWQQAVAYATKQGQGWRLPTLDELNTLVEKACYGPAINETYFPDTPLSNETWSGTEEGKEYAAYVTFYNGEAGSNDKVNPFFVRLVKTVQ